MTFKRKTDMKALSTLFLISITILIVACEFGPTGSSAPQLTSDILTLNVGQSRLIGIDKYQIGFDSVLIDDRCLLNSDDNCFYGNASCRFWLHQPGEDTIWLDLNITTGDSLWDSGNLWSIDTAGMLITLVALDPHPRLNETFRHWEYVASLLLTDNFAADSSGANVIPSKMSNIFTRLDDYDLDSAWIETDSLTVQVRHGGGCAEHYYQLFWNPDGFAKSLPPQVDLYLRHFNNADLCQAYLLKKPRFDLSPIKEAYFNYFGVADSTTVLLNIHDYMDDSGDDIQLPYHFTP